MAVVVAKKASEAFWIACPTQMETPAVPTFAPSEAVKTSSKPHLCERSLSLPTVCFARPARGREWERGPNRRDDGRRDDDRQRERRCVPSSIVRGLIYFRNLSQRVSSCSPVQRDPETVPRRGYFYEHDNRRGGGGGGGRGGFRDYDDRRHSGGCKSTWMELERVASLLPGCGAVRGGSREANMPWSHDKFEVSPDN